MRLVFPLMLVLLGVAVVGFLVTNPSTRVPVTLGNTTYQDVPLLVVALVAMAAGMAFTAGVALFEGATIRLANRGLKREIERLSDENRFLRAQAAGGSAFDPLASPASDGTEVRGEGWEEGSGSFEPASAPVYDPNAEDPTDNYDR